MSVHRKLETAANIAIIVVSVLLGWVVVTKFMISTRESAIAPSTRKTASQLAVGRKVTLSDVNWEANRRTLVLALRKDCRFCDEGAEFYRKLVGHAGKKGIPVIAVLPDQEADGRAYVRTLGLDIQNVRQADLKKLEIAGTPMVIVVDHQGAVERAWLGKLPPREEEEVLRTIG